MLKMEYFNFRLLLGVLRSKKKYPADGGTILYILQNVLGNFKLPQVTLTYLTCFA